MSTTRPDTREMVIVHRVFRREIRLLARLVAAVPARDRARVRVLTAHATEILDGLHHHHTSEDELLWPLLAARTTFAPSLVTRMQAQHDAAAAQLDEVRSLLPRWAGGATDVGAVLAQRLEALADVLDLHLDEEERDVLPLVEQHLTVAEWERLAEHGRSSVPRSRRLIFLGAMLEDATAQERALLFGALPPIARALWRASGRRAYTRHVASVRGTSLALTRR
ncbi:hemerythrin domain-containing protein [Actinomadura flavalba]|uniref:hemerythrin domain-containing protein n=1 Tax=Actinomadura flavalba TaxID=1120938 RepID=UPI00035F2239|nr:hemerythrin domain-containing protein [Actinomadura flavalba]